MHKCPVGSPKVINKTVSSILIRISAISTYHRPAIGIIILALSNSFELRAGFRLRPFSISVAIMPAFLTTRLDFHQLALLTAWHIFIGVCKEQGHIHRALLKPDY